MQFQAPPGPPTRAAWRFRSRAPQRLLPRLDVAVFLAAVCLAVVLWAVAFLAAGLSAAVLFVAVFLAAGARLDELPSASASRSAVAVSLVRSTSSAGLARDGRRSAARMRSVGTLGRRSAVSRPLFSCSVSVNWV